MEESVMTVLTVEEVISNELVKANVTDAVIASLKEKYMPLQIKGIEDKETYQLVKDGRKDCKKWRIAAEKICKAGREDAVAIQKAWVSKEKDIAGRIGEVEGYLEKQEKEFDAAVAKDKEDRKRKHEEQLILRQQVLTGMGVLYAGGSYILGEVAFELSVVKECESDIWEESILPKYKEEYRKVQAEHLEQERVNREKEAEFKRQQEELEQRQNELADREAALKVAEEERLQKEKEEQSRRELEIRKEQKRVYDSRFNALILLGMTHKWPDGIIVYEDIIVNEGWLRESNDEAWAGILNEIMPKIEQKKGDAEQKRLSEIEEQKEITRRNGLREFRVAALGQYDTAYHERMGDLSVLPNEEWMELIEKSKTGYEQRQKEKWETDQEQKRVQEEMKKALEMEQGKDKEKWDEIMARVNAIIVYEMRSSQYRKKAMILREKLEEIKAL